MSKVKVVLLGLLAALAATVAMTSTAVANGTHVFLIEQTPLASSEAIEGTSKTTHVEVQTKGTLLYTECEEDKNSGVIKPAGTLTFKIEFNKCKAFTRSKTHAKELLTACAVTEPVKASGEGSTSDFGLTEFNSFKGELEITGGTCALTGKYTIEGKQTCAASESSIDAEKHTLACTPAGSALKLKTEPAQFFGEETLNLKSKLKWQTFS